VIVLVVSAFGIALLSRQLGVADTVAILVCGVAAGWALARLAALRR
jgi:hypothetical protein